MLSLLAKALTSAGQGNVKFEICAELERIAYLREILIYDKKNFKTSHLKVTKTWSHRLV